MMPRKLSLSGVCPRIKSFGVKWCVERRGHGSTGTGSAGESPAPVYSEVKTPVQEMRGRGREVEAFYGKLG